MAPLFSSCSLWMSNSVFGQQRRFFCFYYLIRPTFLPEAVLEKKEIVDVINNQTGAVDQQAIVVTRRRVTGQRRSTASKRRRTSALAIPEVF